MYEIFNQTRHSFSKPVHRYSIVYLFILSIVYFKLENEGFEYNLLILNILL